MRTNRLTKDYGLLTADERFRLILAAGGRGDEAEQDRLIQAGQRVTFSMSDHEPYAHAFGDLSKRVFLDLLDEAHRYYDALNRADRFSPADDYPEDEEELLVDDDAVPSVYERHLDLALAAGFMLRTRADGWKLFCQRLSIPDDAMWFLLPGYDRLQTALALAEKAAFVPEGFLRWLNRTRDTGQPELSVVPLSSERIADDLGACYRQMAAWWNGENAQ